MISACSSASSMILGIARCEVLSAADRAIEVIPGTEAITWNGGEFSLGDCVCSFPDRMTLRTEPLRQRQAVTGLPNLLSFAKSRRERQHDHRHQPDARSTHVPYSNVTRPMPT